MLLALRNQDNYFSRAFSASSSHSLDKSYWRIRSIEANDEVDITDI